MGKGKKAFDSRAWFNASTLRKWLHRELKEGVAGWHGRSALLHYVLPGLCSGIPLEGPPDTRVFGLCPAGRGTESYSQACNTVLSDRDATATAEVNAIRAATQRLETHNLSGCDIYCTVHPDLMSLGAILWARIDNVYCGVTQQVAAQSGFEDGIIHFKDLIETMDNERKITDVVVGVAKDDCEKVFQEWSDRNGVIY
ncbi:unnamed protein product [Prorocentrum cordatum]|uniref:CMP/dCMP-type deaminase domain-containing protein n=1 Tax=Prorocentrum cordatum TaxID=2364126 RepID=A0ABN9Q5P5_9DINO|nr:unnamed protein product [Polarella glacialis]